MAKDFRDVNLLHVKNINITCDIFGVILKPFISAG